MKSFLRWAGSKRQSVNILKKYWSNEYNRYVEPFMGSACLFFEIQPQVALLGDLNGELVNTYNSIVLSCSRVYYELSLFKISESDYYRLRAISVDKLDRYQRAARFIYLNRFCFNGLYRTNKKGQFNVPYGGGRSGSLPSYKELLGYRKALVNATLVKGDFSKVLDQVQSGDFVYLDPPYSIKNRRIFNEYDSSIFSELDLMRLKTYLDKFNSKGIPFLVSYSDSEEADILSEGFRVSYTYIRRNIAGFASHRKTDKEILIFNT